MRPSSAPIHTNHNDRTDYDPEILSSPRGPYKNSDIRIPFHCERLSLSDPPDMSDPTDSAEQQAQSRWCQKCSSWFHSSEAFLEHRRTSALHITCGYCDIARDFADLADLCLHCGDAHFVCPYCEGLSVWRTAAALEEHYRIDHFTCGLCIIPQCFTTLAALQAHYGASHYTCPRCLDTPVFQHQEGLREHCLRKHFGCSCCPIATWSDDEEALKSHLHASHGFFDCQFCSPQQPQIIWPAPWREHMEQCYYPNPCSEDFDPDACDTIDWCDLCATRIPPQKRMVHFAIDHFCQDCARYGTIFKMQRSHHLEHCSLLGRQAGSQWSKKTYDETQNTRPSGREQWDRKAQQGESANHGRWRYEQKQKGRRNEWAWEHFERQESTFRTQANEQGATPPSSPPPPKQKHLQEPASLDIYTILKISPQSSPDDAKRAVRVRRIETHPDKRKRQGLSREEDDIDEEAKLVGWAADIVLDPKKRQKYDEEGQA